MPLWNTHGGRCRIFSSAAARKRGDFAQGKVLWGERVMSTATSITNKKRQRGFNIAEVLIATAVAAALASGAAPSFSGALQRQQLTSATHEWMSMVALARSEAVTRGVRVSLAPVSAGDWSSGLRVFVDRNSNGVVDEDDLVVRETAAAGGMRVTARFGAYHARYLSFNSHGQVRHPTSDGLVLGRMVMQMGNDTRTLCFASGRVRVVNDDECAR
jgi:prepilin-type N-terminal cleavage/methylation domain-containing protein